MNIIDVVIAYRFVTILSTPWTSMEAFKYGIINKNGKILKKRSELTTAQEKAAYPDVFFTLCWNIKRILEKVGFKSQLTNFAAALWLLKEKYGETDPMKFERLLNDIFNERGISLKPIIAEHKNNNLIEPGVYRLYNKLYRVKESVKPVGDVFGIPVFKFGNKVFILDELKRVAEDGAAVAAPANNVGGGAIAGVSPGQDPPMPKSVAKKRKKMLKRQQDRITKDVKTLNIIDPSGQK